MWGRQLLVLPYAAVYGSGLTASMLIKWLELCIDCEQPGWEEKGR
jgi:hypothetical protein